MILYQLTDEDAAHVAEGLGLKRSLTEGELIDIKKCVENGLGECWYDVMESAVESCVSELEKGGVSDF